MFNLVNCAAGSMHEAGAATIAALLMRSSGAAICLVATTCAGCFLGLALDPLFVRILAIFYRLTCILSNNTHAYMHTCTGCSQTWPWTPQSPTHSRARPWTQTGEQQGPHKRAALFQHPAR